MILPVAKGLHPILARILLFFCEMRVGRATRFRFTSDFNPNHQFKNTSDASYSRFCHNMDMRRAEVRYQTTPLSVGWTRRSLKVTRPIMKAAKRITDSILILCPENDTVVKIKPQYRFAKKCKTCIIESVKNAKHSMLTGDDETVKAHITRTIEYYNS
jgi:alpha-beta hydrolase superfamily lysophospholipase